MSPTYILFYLLVYFLHRYLSHTSKVRFVPEGASCAPDRYCFHQECVLPHVVFQSICPTGPVNKQLENGHIIYKNVTCSDHGVSE